MTMKAILALLVLLPAVALAGSPLGLSSPLLVWGHKGRGAHVSYEVMPNAEEVASELVLGALGKEASSHIVHAAESSTVIMFVGSQLDAMDMRSSATAVQTLDNLLASAASSLALPYTTSKGVSIRESVCTKLDAASIQHEVVGCNAPSADLNADVAAALAKTSSAQQHVLIVCSHIESAQENTNAGLALEVEQLQAVQAAVEAAGVDHPVFVYASQAKATTVSAQGGKRRSLLVTYTGFGPYTSCGTLCQTQVRWLEGMLAVLFMALASCAGLVCLYVLDTPTRFDAPKEVAMGPQ